MIHNHPSGDPFPSRGDSSITGQIANNVEGFRGHAVINGDSYGLVDAYGETGVFELFEPSEDELLTPSVEHPLLGLRVNGPMDAVRAGKELQKKGWFSLVGLSKAKIRSILEVPLKMLDQVLPGENYGEKDGGKSGLKLFAVIRRFAINTGAQNILAVGVPDLRGDFYSRDSGAPLFCDLFDKAIETRLLTDIVDVS